ncbi:MFS transporter, DHA1 family [Terrimicrobium sacchariphilum]|uniref:MFS transporter, DHA1 family n=1 Tax=Terrimicrobium sacchariphilum TaxID=690879 RepID=A0A146G6N9_TERSA|nr:MFS transporter, DHA1 family [Terrimicrobium sacchariphilum]
MKSTAGHHKGVPFLLAALSALGPFSIDAYLPSFRDIGHHFGASPLVVQQTITAYLLPFGAMTLFHGALSDSFGRRRVTLIMVAIFVLASIGCMCAWSIESLISFRVLQGLSAGGGMIIGRAMVRDLFDGIEAQRLMSQIAVVFAIAPALGPIVGGWLQMAVGWRAVFGFLVVFSALVWLACWKALPETLPHANRQPLHPLHLLRGYWGALSSIQFVTLAVTLTLNFSAVFVYIVSAPAFIFGILRRQETEFFWLFGPITAGMMLGTALAGRLAGRLSSARILTSAYGLMFASALGNFVFSLTHPPSLPWSIVPLFFYVVGSAMGMPTLTIMALDIFPHRRGLASSCQGFIQTSGNTIITAVAAPALWSSALYLSMGMLGIFLTSGVALLAYSLLSRASRKRLPIRTPG